MSKTLLIVGAGGISIEEARGEQIEDRCERVAYTRSDQY